MCLEHWECTNSTCLVLGLRPRKIDGNVNFYSKLTFFANKFLIFVDVVTREAEFTLGELALIPYGRNKEGIMHTVCDLQAKNHLFCTSEERTKGWTLTSEHIFSKVRKSECFFHFFFIMFTFRLEY